MTTSYKNANKKKGTDEESADQQVLADLGEGSNLPISRSSMGLALGKVTGDVARTDLNIPTMSLVQGTGDLHEQFDRKKDGALVLNKEIVLAELGDIVKVTVLTIDKTYEDNLEWDPDVRPETYESLEQVVAAGLWIDWRNNQKPPVREVANVVLFIEEPEGVDALSFNYEFEGKNYALARWTLRKTGYKHGAKKIFSASQIELANDGLLAGEWELSTSAEKAKGNTYYVPVMRLAGRNSAEKVAFITERLS